MCYFMHFVSKYTGIMMGVITVACNKIIELRRSLAWGYYNLVLIVRCSNNSRDDLILEGTVGMCFLWGGLNAEVVEFSL